MMKKSITRKVSSVSNYKIQVLKLFCQVVLKFLTSYPDRPGNLKFCEPMMLFFRQTLDPLSNILLQGGRRGNYSLFHVQAKDLLNTHHTLQPTHNYSFSASPGEFLLPHFQLLKSHSVFKLNSKHHLFFYQIFIPSTSTESRGWG